MILLTGSSGVVGSAVRERLGDAKLTSLQHRRLIDGPGPALVGDITKERLGLSGDDYREACRDIDIVIHSAAAVTMAGRPEDYERINVEGTRQVVRFAEQAEALLIHVSTAFVRGAPSSGPLTYAASKQQAEEVVRASSARSFIVRPSIVAGDSKSGRIASEQGFHQVMGSLLHGPVRIVPGDDSMLVDFVPQDYVGEAIAHLVAGPEVPDELWLTSGPSALGAGEAVRIINAFIEEHGLPGKPARLVPDQMVSRLFVPAFLDELPARQRARMKILLHLAGQMRTEVEFPCSAETISERFGVVLPDATEVFENNLRALLARSDESLTLSTR
jgi:nucleoside-diphosphate-sugar epimerase